VTTSACLQAAVSHKPPPWLSADTYVCMLAKSFTVLKISESPDPGALFSPYYIGETAQFFLARWCHRCSLPADDIYAEADPLSQFHGCDRLIFARLTQNRGGRGIGEGSPPLGSTITRLNTLKRSTDDKKERARKANAELDGIGRGRFRSDDAFAGVAFCEVQSIDAGMHLVDVTVVMKTRRDEDEDDRWCIESPGAPTPEWATGFSGSQGDLLSGFYQFRTNPNIHVRPGSLV
jgi:hypothetical protein